MTLAGVSYPDLKIMMDEAVRDYRIKQNDIIATSGFGAGLSWGAALIKWG